MTDEDLADLYHGYIACLNAQDWANLGKFVGDEVQHNGETLGLSGYRRMLEGDFEAIPDLRFNIEFMVCQKPRVAARLHFDCRPKGMLFGLPVNGQRVAFAENVFYEFRDGRMREVWSLIDTAAIQAQI